VTRQVYLGAARDYMVEVADGTSLRATTPTETSVQKGSEVWLTLPPERCRALSRKNNKKREDAMKARKLSRRDILQGAATLAAGAVFASPFAPRRRSRSRSRLIWWRRRRRKAN
jgi:hypothetical protein